jgi:hypothetical protein
LTFECVILLRHQLIIRTNVEHVHQHLGHCGRKR